MLRWFFQTTVLIATAVTVSAQTPPQAAPDAKPSMEVYGFTMLDMGHNFTSINPNWFDTLRVTRLPSFDEQFGEDHSHFAGVRQSRLGVRSTVPTDLGDLKTTFEFELFGTGVDEEIGRASCRERVENTGGGGVL